MIQRYIGIDPGRGGAIAAIDVIDGRRYSTVSRMPETDRELLDAVRRLAADADALAFVENVTAFAPVGQRMGSASAFAFGRGVGAIHMALTAAEIPFELVVPRKWQATIGCLSRGDKNVTKRAAERLFPKIKITHYVADALLIAEYCRRVRQTSRP